MTHWESFFDCQPPPPKFEENEHLIEEFCQKNKNEKIVLVTSGGTCGPKKRNTVRIVKNSIAVTRGCASAENFLKAGYAVIFIHRLNSLEPFKRHFHAAPDAENVQINGTKEEPEYLVRNKILVKLLPIILQYTRTKRNGKLLCINFISLTEYIWLLRAAAQALAPLSKNAMIYIAAACDFYVPKHQISTNKMELGDGGPTSLPHLLSKILEPIVSLWTPNAYVVSFESGIDQDLLITKARNTLRRYKHEVVIGNLQTRKYHVVVVTKDSEYDIAIDKDSPEEVETNLVADLMKRHEEFLKLDEKE